jgi:hypothetical protein
MNVHYRDYLRQWRLQVIYLSSTHTSLTCKLPKAGHKTEATRVDNMGGSQANRE